MKVSTISIAMLENIALCLEISVIPILRITSSFQIFWVMQIKMKERMWENF